MPSDPPDNTPDLGTLPEPVRSPHPTTLPGPPPSTGAGSDSTQAQDQAPTHLFEESGLPIVPGFYVSREVARGGMGVVYAAYDPTFEREVAVKVMHNGQDAGRFVVESKVTAKLPHPGIPPVYTLGTLVDGRPFLAMKLIQGHTLAAELQGQSQQDLLGIFEQICQTVGFAHSVGIIHRDLKPANIMVGSFGEVLVMDWGLAKQVGSDDDSRGAATRSGAHDDQTQLGQVKGTPAYMAPEQARGESVDARADVFALGGILAVMLTGQPPFRGDTVFDTIRKAAHAEVNECFARLDSCGVDAELLAIAKKCMAAEPAGRFASGVEVAASVAAYRAGVEARLQQAERDRAAAEAKAAEEVNTRREAEARVVEQRKKRRVQLLLAAAVAFFLMVGGGVAWALDREASERKLRNERAEADRKAEEARREADARAKAENDRQGVAGARALAASLRTQYRFKEADAALLQAEKLAASAPEVLAHVQQDRDDLAFVVLLDGIRFRKWIWLEDEGRFNMTNTAEDYRRAFAAHGIDLLTLAPADAAKKLAASGIKVELLAALDDWVTYSKNTQTSNRLLEVGRLADPGPWSERLRNPFVWMRKNALVKLVAEADFRTMPPVAVALLAKLMERHGLDPSALLANGRARHPGSFELAFAAGLWHGTRRDAAQQIGAYEAARALRPDHVAVTYNLGHARREYGDIDGAIAAFRVASELDSSFAHAHFNLGVVLKMKNQPDAALAAYRNALRADPTYTAAYNNIGSILHEKGDLDGAIMVYKAALRVAPTNAHALSNLGIAFKANGDLTTAITLYRLANKADPRYAYAYYNLGIALAAQGDSTGAIAAYREAIKRDPKHADAHYKLGVTLRANRKPDEAIPILREAIKLDPKAAKSYAALADALADKRDMLGATAALNTAIKLDPNDATFRYNLGLALTARGDTAGAVASYKEVIRLDPNYAKAHNNLGVIYLDQKKYTEGIAAARAAIKADPKFSNAYALLADLLQRTGDLPGARAALTEAARLDKRWQPLLDKLPKEPR